MAAGLGASLGLRHDFGSVQALAETDVMQLSNGQLRRQFSVAGQYNLSRQQGLRINFSHRRHPQGAQDNSLTLEYRHHLR
ncbi:MAG: hypothetical protein V7629_14510 [Motiliproteus sp.]